MDDLERTLATVRARIAKAKGARRLNEQDTKATLIDPVLRALGWDLEDVDQVQREFKARKGHDPVDYALLLLRTPKLLIEAKALGADISDQRVLAQVASYATFSGVGWVLVTDGDAYALYNALAKVHFEEKRFRSFRLSDGGAEAAETLRLLGSDALRGSRLEELWRNYSVDGRVQKAIEALFANGGDHALARLVVKRTEGLGQAAVRASIGRAHISINFPVPPPVVPPKGGPNPPISPPPKVRKPKGPRPPGEDATSLADLLGAGLMVAGQELVKRFRGKDLTATVEADGRVRFQGTLYDSISMAGSLARESVVGKHKWRKIWPTNGWTFWQYVDAAGKRRYVDDLRQDLIKKRAGGK